MKTPIHPTRLVLEENGDFHKSPKGMLFMDPLNGQFTDLSGVRILRCGVDTVRQLYNGKLRPEVMALFDLSVDVVEFAGYEWSKGRIGRDSGYQYRLQNAEMGLILKSVPADQLDDAVKAQEQAGAALKAALG